jgi:Arc/MetJ family transcription regulator
MAAAVRVSLPADLVLDVMVLTGTRSAQDAVEVVLRDYLQRRQRTEAVTGEAGEARRLLEERPRDPNG